MAATATVGGGHVRNVTPEAVASGAVARNGLVPDQPVMWNTAGDYFYQYESPTSLNPPKEFQDPELRAKLKTDDKPRRPPPTTASPPPPELVPDTKDAIAVCLSPDVCRSPTKPVPYQVWGKGDDDQNYSPDVRSNGLRIKRADSRFTTTYGDEPGTGLGTKSNTVGNVVEPVTSSTIVRANGVPVQRHADRCTLNNGNCPGEYVHVKSTETHSAPDGSDNQERTSQGKPDGRGAGERFADGFTDNASETLEGFKKVVSNTLEGTKNLASNLLNDPGGTIASGVSSVADGAKGAANWTGETASNLWNDPSATVGRGVQNVKDGASGVLHAVADPYSDAYAKGGIAQAAGHGTFDVVKLAVEALATKGAATAAGKVATAGAGIAAKAHRAEEVAERVEQAKRLDKAVEDGAPGGRSTRNEPKTTGRKLTKDEYDKLRKKTPSAKLRDRVNEGQPLASEVNPVDDPWLAGKQRTARLEADHIVPMKSITEMDGFSDLNKANQLEVLNNPENFTGLSRSANGSKGAKSFEQWTTYGAGRDAITVNPTLRQQMISRSEQLQMRLQNQIYDLLSEQ